MLKKGDEIIRNGIAFVYDEYGVWVKKANQSSVVDQEGIPVDVEKNVNTGNYELLVNLQGHLCEDNSTETILGAGESFLGSSFQSTLDYGVISIGVSTDVSSETDGLVIQWSNDGVTINNTDVFTIFGGRDKTFTFGPANLYVRIKYTNGDTPQGAFSISTILRKTYVKPSSHRISDSIVADDDAELMKSIITAQGDDGTYRNVPSDVGGLLRVNSFPYTYAIAEGDILNHSALLKFGTRTSATTTVSTVWEGPTALYVYMSTAQQLKITSTDNTNDNAGGTGALTLTILGLDTNFDEISETVTMTGTTEATTTKSYIRVFRAYVETCGTSLTNTGVISIKNNAGTVTQAIINAGDGQTLMTLWTVPRGKIAYIVQGTFSTDTAKGVRISLFLKKNNGGIIYPWRIRYRTFVFQGNEVFPFQIPFRIPEKTDIEVRCLPGGACGVGSTFELWYEDDDTITTTTTTI